MRSLCKSAILFGLVLAVALFCVVQEGGAQDPFPTAASFLTQRYRPLSTPPTSPSLGSKAGTGEGEEAVAVLRLSLAWNQASSSWSLRGTALEPLPGTGLPSPIGGRDPEKLLGGGTLKIDPASLAALKNLLEGLKAPGTGQPLLTVPITLPMAPEISGRLSRTLASLEWLLLLGVGASATYMGGKVLPLVPRLASGLLSIIQAVSSLRVVPPSDPSSNPASVLPVASQAAPSSIGKPGTSSA